MQAKSKKDSKDAAKIFVAPPPEPVPEKSKKESKDEGKIGQPQADLSSSPVLGLDKPNPRASAPEVRVTLLTTTYNSGTKQ